MRVIVIGAGLSGLAAAHALHRHGHDVCVLERHSQVGGSVRTIRRDGYLVETGPNTLQLNDPELETVLSDWGMLEDAIEANPAARKRYILKNCKPCAVPQTPLAGLTTPLFPLSGKLRVLREPFIPRTHERDESLANFVRRRLGRSFLDYAINPMVGGVYAGDPEQLSVRYAFPKVWHLEQEHGSLIRGALAKQRARRKAGTSFRTRLLSWPNGMAQLVEQLVAPLDLHTDCSIHAIESKGKAWQVRWSSQKGSQESHADKILVAVPAFALNELPLPVSARCQLADLSHIAYPPVSVLAMGFRRKDIAHALDGFGMLVPEVEERAILGTLFSSTLFPGRAPEGQVLLTTFVGGTRDPELARLPIEALKERVTREFMELLGATGESVFCEHRHWERAIPQYTSGYGRYLNTLKQTETAHPGLHFIGNYRGGIAAGKCLMEGVRCVRSLEAAQAR